MSQRSQVESDKIIDEWVEKANKNRGAVRELYKKLGPYPIDERNFMGQQMNEWVTTDAIRHFAATLGDRNPMWWNEEYAKKTRWGGIIAPATFIDFICPPYTAIKVESPVEYAFPGMVGGCKREWLQAIRPGDRIKAVTKWLGLEERPTKQDPKRFRLFINTDQYRYMNQKEETVAVVDSRFMILATYADPAAAAQPLFAGGGRKRHKLTDEERDAIYRGYDTETRRGADTLFWEDVNVGEEIKPLVVGPLSAWDTAAFLVAIPGFAVAFDMEWDRIKLDFGGAWLDPEVNAWKRGAEAHFSDGSGHADMVSGGYAFGFGGQIEGLICRGLYNWMGDDGFLRKIDSQYRVLVIHGDVLYVKGKVTSKSFEGNEHLVDLEVRCENQDGLVLVPAKATVRLLSRTQSYRR